MATPKNILNLKDTLYLQDTRSLRLQQLPLRLNSQIHPEKKDKQEITKLAIGMEGGIDQPKEEIEVKAHLFEMGKEGVKEFEGSEKILEELQKIDSAYKKAEVQAWEQQINPCEHSLTLVQDIKEAIKTGDLVKCGYCDLKENLWICLVCGHLACGRKYHDGSGGNGHALEHAQATQHSLAVKSGTISPEGDASVYCYTCDDDVKDNYLPSHLKNLGIDVMDMKKTDKTVTEMVSLTFTYFLEP